MNSEIIQALLSQIVAHMHERGGVEVVGDFNYGEKRYRLKIEEVVDAAKQPILDEAELEEALGL